jgi:hypothetical protein
MAVDCLLPLLAVQPMITDEPVENKLLNPLACLYIKYLDSEVI